MISHDHFKHWDSTNTQEPMYTSSSIPVSAVRLVIIHQSDRKYVTKEDIERLQSFGLVPLFVEFVNKVILEGMEQEVQDAT